MHRRFIIVLRSVMLLVILTGILGQPRPVQAADVGLITGGVSATVKDFFPTVFDRSPLPNAPEAASVPEAAAPLIGGPVTVSADNPSASIDVSSANQSRELNTAHLIGIDPYTLPPFPTSSFSGGLTITPITAYNLIVDSNVLSPSSYGPSAATLGAQFCNTSGSAMTNVWAYVGDYNADNDSTPGEAGDLTPGTYPVHNQTTDPAFNATFPHLATPPTQVDYGDLTRFYALEQESGTSSDSVDASRYIGTLTAGECRTEYWLVSYPRKALIGSSWVDVTGGVKPEDDLWLSYFFWATSGATSSNHSYVWNPVTMRNEISAMANKIWPNGDNKVPDQYIQAIQQVLGWDTWTPNGSGTTAYPGETVTSQGIWYDLGNVGAGFDNNGDFVPDRNIWVQPIGDSNAYDPGCFRLVRTYGLVIVKLNDGTELLIPFVDQMYFESIPENNNGAVGLVFYEYVALDGACTAGLTPYQEVASGYDNEKFNADFGAGIPPLQSQQTNMTFDKNGQTSIGLGGTIDYTMTFTLPDVNPTDGMVITVGNPSLGMPLTYYETVPAGLQYVAGSASANVTMTNYSVGVVPATRLWSVNSGATWSETEPAADTLSSAPNNLVMIQWLLAQGIASPATGPAVLGQVSFSARVPGTYTPTVVNNTSCLKLGGADCFVEDTHTTLVTGTGRIEGTVWRDDATGSGILGNGILDETGAGINAVTVNLYWDANGDGDHTDAGDFLYTTTTSNASGDYSFTNLPATSGSARFLIEVNASDSDIPQGYGPTTATAYTRISLAAGGIYGDAANEPSDFGFAPALDVDKRVDTTGTIMEGDTIQYTIAVSNTLPGSGESSTMCQYSVWAGAESTSGVPTTGSGNSAWQNVQYSLGRPDNRFSTTIMSNNTDIVGLSGFNTGQQAGNITSVRYVVYMKELVDFGDDQFIVRVYYNNVLARTDTYLNATLSSPLGTVYELEQDITSLRSWTWADFQNNLTEMQVEGNRISGDSGDAAMDAVGFIITTDQPCGDAGSVLNPVPLTDTFDDTYFDFISANPPVSASGTGTLTWNNVGPLYPGQTRYITVYMRAALAGTSPATVNTATSTNSKFANGLPANSPESDAANATIVANSNTRTFSGTIFDDNSSPLNGWSGAAWTRAGTETGYDSLGTTDTALQYIPVDLYACFDASTGLLVSSNTNSPCATAAAGNDGEWRLVRTTSTNASGQYSFGNLAAGFYYAQVNYSLIAGPQVADVNMSGVCSPCDSRSNNPITDNVNAAFIGNLVGGNTAVSRVNFGYNVPAGSYNIGDFFFYDWDGDGVQDASDEPMAGVRVRLLAADGSPILDAFGQPMTATTNSSGIYGFSSRPVGYYTVQVDTSTLPAGVVQTKDPDAAMDNQSTFVLTANDLTRDFAYQPAGSGTIGDTVWKDINGDGSQSSSEPGIAGVTVVLQADLNGDGTYANIATAVTDVNGKYLFTDLPQGTYRVALERNGNSAVIPNDAFGNDYLPSTGTTSGSFVYRTATLPTSTSSDLTADFGFAPPASIGDTVYYDLNGNGTQDFNEAGINGVTVALYTFTDANANHRYDPGEALSAPVASATTATVNGKTGFYQFTGLTPGNYVVQVTPPAAMTLTGDPNTDGFACPDLHDPADPGEPSSLVCDSREGMRLYNGTNYTGADFGYQPLGVIGDTLWIDTDADGLRDLSEQGIANITVRLCGDAACTAVVQTTTTDLDGYYSFGSVPDGTYYVRVSTAGLPAGLTVTYNAPHDSFTDDVTRLLIAGGVVTEVGDVTPACTNCSLTVDFGYRYVGVLDLSGTLCLENASANGVCGTTGSGVGANESAYANVVVYLYLWNDDGDGVVEPIEVTQVASTQTNASGDYSFENIRGGVYYVVAIGAPQDDIQLTTTQASLGAPTTQVHETTDNDGDTISAYQVVEVGASDVQNRDFAFEAGPLDYGDLPSTYSTLLNDSPAGPSHTVPVTPTLYLGATAPDTETNGSPTADATGDGADEDGVTLVGVWGNGAYNAVNGTGGAVGVNVHGSGYLAGWIDFNRDGDFTDAGEMIVHQAVATGTANYTFDIPADTFAGPGDPASLTLYARFRLFDAEPMFPALAYAGAAGDGEVEDYAFHWTTTVDKDTATPTVTPTGTVIYLVALVNGGDGTLTNLQATDVLPDFNGAAAGKGYTVLDVAATGGMAVNFPGFDGDTNPNLLAAGNSLPARTSRAITITLTLSGAVAGTYDNTVSVSSTQTGTFDDDGTLAQDPGTPTGSDLEIDEDVTVGSNGSLVIVKNTLPDDAQDFAYTVSGTGLTPFTLDDDADAALANTQTFNSLAAGGTYTVTETAVAGWSVTNISCTGATSSTVTIGAAGGFNAGDTAVSVVLAAGETVTCTFENTAILSVVTTKTASDTSVPETGQSVTYIVQVENTSPVEVILDSLTDDLFHDITTTGHDNVTATTCATGGALAPGATYTCAFAATVSGTFPGTHVNTVTAQIRNGSSTASDADNETVTFEEASPELTVIKSSSAGGTVHPGDAITYTVTITNTGNVTQNNIAVSDAQPAGTAYVSFSSIATGYSITLPQYYLDRFEIAQFNNSNGSTAWGGTPWTETGDNGIANSGKIQINTSTPFVADFQATAPTDVLTLTRPVNLTNAASATLTYSIAENGINSAADTAWVQVWNGTAWTTVATYAGDFTSAVGNVNILAYANAGTQIRFVVTGFDGMTQNLTLDNVRVEYTFAFATVKDNDPFGGVPGSLINGSPPTLLFSGDSFDLLPGQSMTVSYRATVNNPVPSGQTQVVNTASVTSAEIVTPVQATVTDTILNGSLTIIKDSLPNDAQDFAFTVGAPLTAFTLDDDSDGALSNTQVFSGLVPATYTVAETPSAGWSLTNIVCSGATGSTISIGTDADFDAGDTNVSVNLAAGENITCTFTNTRLITLTLRKTWVNATLNDVVNVTAAVSGATIDTLSSTANTANETDTDATPVNVTAGLVITFGETFTAGSAAHYTSSFACTGAIDTDLSDGLTVNAADTAIVCTETNARKTATLTMRKTWVGAVPGDVGIVTVTGTNNDSFSPVADTPNETDTDPTPTTVYAGETVTLSEAFNGMNTAWYTHTLSCSGAADSDLASGELTIDPADTSITCTFTNTVIPQWPTISKSFSPNPIAAGATSTLSLVIANPNVGATLTGVAFDDSYPGGLVNTTPVVISNTCGGTLTAVDGGNSVSLSGGSIAPNSNCTITVTVTSAAAGTYTNTTGPVSFSGVVTGNTATATLNVITNAIISDRIWNDVDGDGIQDAGETGLGGGIRVYLDGNNNNVYDAGEVSDVTDASGIYAITGLAAGTYSVRADTTTLPAGYAPTYDLDGGLDHEASVTLAAGQTLDTVDFGYQQLAAIGNFVWHDLDMDGIQDGGETGIVGATVNLLDNLGNPVDTILTNASGIYSFTVRPGSYVVEFVPPAGYLHSLQDQGADDTLDSDASVLTGRTAAVTVTAGEVNNTIDAGMYRLGTIVGQVRYDVDNDGNPVDGDSGIDTVTIGLRTDPNGDGNPADGVLVTSTTTNGTGDYSFTNVPPGNYVVVETNPAGYVSTYDLDGLTGNTLDQIGISLSSGGNSTGNDFLDTFLYSISGQVRYDVDADGNLADADSGLASANVSLWTDPNGDGNPADGTQVGATVTTDATGSYSFPNVIPGNYVVVEANPAGYASTADSAAPNNDRIPVVISNANGTGNAFLDTNMAVLGDFVWDDASGNGVQDAGESGLAGVTVRLLDGSGTVVATTATTASGLYSFTVPAGTYRVDFDLPVGYIFTLVNQGGNDAIDSDADRTTGETANYTLAPGETNNTIDAGMVWPSAIGNFVWNDLDADGVQDPGENGIDGVTVDVYRSGDALPTATQTTAGGGGYFFGLLTPGDYYLHFTLPGGYVFTTPDAAAATDATDSDASGSTGNTAVTVLLAGEMDSTWDAGMYQPVDLRVTKTDGVATYIPNGSLTYTIRVWNTGPSDAVDASFMDNMPASISSWSWACAATGSASCGSTTSGTGNISLNDIDLPADAGGTTDYLTFTIDATVSGSAIGPLTNDVAVTAPSSSHETNLTDNSASDTDTLANATLTLQKTVVNDNGGAAVDTDWTLTATGPTTISGSEGQPAITGAAVPTGTYTLSESVGPAGYAAASWSCPAAADHDLSDGLTIGAGENVTCSITNNDQPASIGNYVWNDSDGQGDQDEAAAGLNGVTVNVYRDDGDGVFEPGLGDTLAGTDVTDSAGAYNVASLSAGAYFVDILGPAGYTLTTANDPLFVLLALGQNYTLADFGFQQTNATISDYLWNDANGDSLQAGESGLGAGIRVYVDLDHDDSYDVGEPTDLTDASGLYAITGLPAGTYDVRVANPPAGYLQTYDLDGTGTSNEASVTVTAGQTRTDVDFGYQLISPELTVAKSSITTSLSAPGTVTYSYLVTNTGNVNLTGIGLSDDNDNDDMACPATTLAPAGSMTCAATHTFTQAELDANGSPTAASGVLANIVTANATELTDPVTDDLDIPIMRTPAINIAKAPATQAVISGNTATFTLNVTNTGNVTLTGVIVTDAQCTGLPVYTGGDANSDGRLQFTETWTYTCSTINVITSFTNTASVTTTQGATDSDTASVTVIVPQADLELTKLVSNAAPYVATDITFTLNIVNRGPDAATGVSVTDVIPTGFTYISDDGGGAYDPATGVWTVGSLANGATRSLTITVRVNVSGSYVNYTQVASSSLTDPDSTPNNASTTEDDDDSVTITPATGDPSGLGKVVVNSNEASTTNPNVAMGEIVTYRLSVNIPPGVFTSARLVDTMERGLSYMDCVGITPNGLTTDVVGGFASICANPTVDNAGGTTTVDVGRRVTFDFGTLTNNTATDQTLLVAYRAVVLDSAQNISGVNLDNSAEFLWGGGSLGPAFETLVIAEPDVSIVKTASAASVVVGDEITITLTIQHTAASETNAFDVVVTDDLPADLQYVAGSLECVSGAQPANTCSEAGGIITAGWNNFTLAGGNGRVTFRVTVLSLPAGGVVNTANVAWTSLPGVPPSGPGFPPGQQNANVFSTERGYDPGDLIDVYGASSALSLGIPAGGGAMGQKGSSSRKTLPATGFAPGKVTDLSNIPQETYLSANGVTIEIPSLGISLPVVGVPLKDGTWDVSWLGKQAGWLEGSAFPSWNGNSVLTGHVYLSNGLPGPFVNLSALKYGDKIIVHAYGQKYTFEVRENVVVQPEDTSLLKHETKPWLTLVTCKEYDEKANTYRKRVVVRAVLVSVAWE